jgi:hypothetical protein
MIMTHNDIDFIFSGITSRCFRELLFSSPDHDHEEGRKEKQNQRQISHQVG